MYFELTHILSGVIPCHWFALTSKHQDPTFAKRVGQLIYAAMRSAIGVPEHDNFQILAEHDEQHFIFDTQYLGIQRTDNLVVIQITMNEGRTLEQKNCSTRPLPRA